MKEKEIKENRLSNFLRISALVEAVVIIILIAIAFSTKNVFLFRVLLYIGGITAFFAMSLLFLKFIHIIDSNPIGDISSALLILAIFITLVSGIPSVLDFVDFQNIAVDSLNKQTETLKDLHNFMETQTAAMNKSIESLEDLPKFMETQTTAMNKSIVILDEIHDFLLNPKPE